MRTGPMKWAAIGLALLLATACDRNAPTGPPPTAVKVPDDASGHYCEHQVPGSFVEFIQRKVDPDTGRLDLNFDSSNAQGIFKMTASKT